MDNIRLQVCKSALTILRTRLTNRRRRPALPYHRSGRHPSAEKWRQRCPVEDACEAASAGRDSPSRQCAGVESRSDGAD
ncbi:hypothetical protein D917_02411 [Trichinella nativa]|uniref:Uncharacterized protein n=1 Tax=Trichinella nativa TaxID=6335 RepID=A0A1Y3EFZ4_9BILA|nr:hypothetical protein D917_02411 [Trichinella nativa]